MRLGVLFEKICAGVGVVMVGANGGVVSTTLIVLVIGVAALSEESVKLYVYVYVQTVFTSTTHVHTTDPVPSSVSE